MERFIPLELLSYFLFFENHFSKPNFIYFQGYLWGLLLARGRKTMNNIAHCCFWVERSLSSWERFLGENLWDVNEVMKTLVSMLREKLETQLQVHGGYLAGLDTLLVAKNGQKMPGIQGWKDHSGNADRGAKLQGHHWSILGLISFESTSERYWCWVTKMRLISGKLNPFQFVVDSQGLARRATFWDGVIPLVLDLKQHFGLAHYQCYLGIAIDRFVHLACLAYCLFGLFQRQQLNSGWMPPVSARHSELSFSRLRQGLQHFAISRVLFPKSAPEADLKLQSPELDQILRLAA